MEKIKRETIKVVFFAKFVSETDIKSFDKEKASSEIKNSESISEEINSFPNKKVRRNSPCPVALEKSLSTVAVQFSSLRKVCVVKE